MTYQERKARARERAQTWQAWLSAEAVHGVTWGELATVQGILYTLGKRYGLLREFRENGII